MIRIVESQHYAIVEPPKARGGYCHMRKIKSPFPMHVVVLTHSERHGPGVLYVHTHLLNHYHRFFTVICISQVLCCEILVSVIEKPHPNVNRSELELGYSIGEEDSSEGLGLIAVDRIVP